MGVNMFTLMETLAQKVTKLREERGWGKQELERQSGVTRATIVAIEKGEQTNPTKRTLEGLARAFQVPIGELFSTEEAPELKLSSLLAQASRQVEALVLVEIPVLGTVPAGHFDLQEQLVEGYVPIPRSLLGASGKNFYVLNVSGESLAGDNIHSGDQVVVEPAAALVDGKIYIVRINSEVTAKHVYQLDGKVKLVSTNGEYREMVVDDVEILGRVILSGRWRKQ